MSDDTARDRILGQVQELRAELGNLRDRAHARDVKRRALELFVRTVVAPSVPADPGTVEILHRFEGEVRETITRVFGTSAWDEPETVEEALARTSRLGPLPAAPGSGPIAEGAVKSGETITLTFRAPDRCHCGEPIVSLAADRLDNQAAVYAAFHANGSVHRVEGTVEDVGEVGVPRSEPRERLLDAIQEHLDTLSPEERARSVAALEAAAPLTDEDLDQIERAWAGSPVVAHTCGNCGAVNRLATDTGRENIVTAGVPRLAAEVRRLRSDEWLEKAEIALKREADDAGIRSAHAMYVARTEQHVTEEEFRAKVLLHDARAYAEATTQAMQFREFGRAAISILRKHRDGKA